PTGCPVRLQERLRAGEDLVALGSADSGDRAERHAQLDGQRLEEIEVMAGRLGPKWLNQVQSLAAASHPGRLGRFAVVAETVNALEPVLEGESDTELRARADLLRLKARQGDALNGMIVEAFALVREAAKRTIKQRHYDVQVVGGCA